jgi:hypothetical protein
MALALSRPIALVGAILAVAACGGAASGGPSTSGDGSASTAPSPTPAAELTLLWPAPADPMERAVAAGLEPAPKEFTTNHVHSHLDVFVDGQEILVPAGIGINTEDPDVRTFENPVGYGGIEMCDQACISPLHTHDETGTLHTEASESVTHTLGQFFTEWGVDLSETCVGEHCAPTTAIAVYIDGALHEGDPRAIEITDRRVIVVVVGTPPAEIPSTADFSNA